MTARAKSVAWVVVSTLAAAGLVASWLDWVWAGRTVLAALIVFGASAAESYAHQSECDSCRVLRGEVRSLRHALLASDLNGGGRS